MISSMLGWGLTEVWGVSPRHQFMQRSAHPGSKSNKSAKSRREKAKRHQRTAPECRGCRAKARR